MEKSPAVLRALEAALEARWAQHVPPILRWSAGPPADWRGELTRLMEKLEGATPADVVRVALMIPEDRVAEVRVFVAGVMASLGHRPTRPGSEPLKAEASRDETFSMSQAMDYLKVSRKTLRGLVKDGKLHPGRPTRKSWAFSRVELDRFLRATRH
jgi:excisionase family DNA binding protein